MKSFGVHIFGNIVNSDIRCFPYSVKVIDANQKFLA